MKGVLIGAAMGLMLPFVLHGQGAWGGVVFLAAHVAIAAIVVGLATLVPAVKKRFAGHRPSSIHMFQMGGGAAAGWAVICIACPMIFGMAHPWT